MGLLFKYRRHVRTQSYLSTPRGLIIVFKCTWSSSRLHISLHWNSVSAFKKTKQNKTNKTTKKNVRASAGFTPGPPSVALPRDPTEALRVFTLCASALNGGTQPSLTHWHPQAKLRHCQSELSYCHWIERHHDILTEWQRPANEKRIKKNRDCEAV